MQTFPPADTPRIVWVELTSKCPFDCIFCSRKTLRGAGEHMPFPLFEALLRQLCDPRILRLNYSGESTVYPDLIPAIRLARSTGAFVELVSALACVSETALAGLSQSGLNRLTVSIHAIDSGQYKQIYRYSSFEDLRSRLVQFRKLCGIVPNPPVLDIAFVAMDQNLEQLPVVAAFAGSLEISGVFIFPIIRRDEILVRFPSELNETGEHRPDFQQRVELAVGRARQAYPEVEFTICNPAFGRGPAELGQVPISYPHPLPAGARIHSCEQNPWETAHVLSNGDVVACEVLDKKPLGNLARQSLAEIWNGESYRKFREKYQRGEVPECRACPWKTAYQPGPMHSEIIGARGRHAQQLHGWHDPSNEPQIWSSQQAVAAISPRPGSHLLHVSGILPPGPGHETKDLAISCNSVEAGRVVNPGREALAFGIDFPIPAGQPEPWWIQFRTRHVFRPSERGLGTDQRDLGFALVLLASKRFVDPGLARRQLRTLKPLSLAIKAVDRFGRLMRWTGGRSGVNHCCAALGPGLSVIIPERDNLDELADCLLGVREAGKQWTEPIEVIVIVNGSPAANYASLRRSHPSIRWQFHERPMGFGVAISAGLRDARYDWVYLLNNDVTLDPDAFETLRTHRGSSVFSIGSQILLKDSTRFREETNWTALLIEDGVATIHDRIPESDRVAENFYSGGGASLFQTNLLRSLLDASVYDPFYWEDVEWGWRSRKLGYRSLFCPASVARHRQHATIGRHYSADAIEAVFQRNRLLFQLRNFTTVGSVRRVVEEIAQSSRAVAESFLDLRTLAKIARGRIWNHCAPIVDEEVLATGTGSRIEAPESPADRMPSE